MKKGNLLFLWLFCDLCVLICVFVVNSLSLISNDEFSDLEFGSAEIYQKSMSDSSSFEVAHQLRDMSIRNALTGFQFGDQLILDEKIGEKTSDQCAVFVEYTQWMLLYEFYAQFGESMSQGILVHLFQMPVSQVDMDVIARLPDHIAKTQYLIIAHQLSSIHNPPLPLCDFCVPFVILW
jgi:hypothetical protein